MLAPSLTSFKAVLDRVNDAVYVVDDQRRIAFCNEGAHRLTGYSPEQVLYQTCPDAVWCHLNDLGQKLCGDRCPLAASIAYGSTREVRVFLRHRFGHRVPVTVRVEPLRAADGSIIGAAQIFGDDSGHYHTLRRLEHMERLAFLDHLTQIPNRRFLEMSLQGGIGNYKCHNVEDAFGVLVIDVDNLKSINGRFGHAAGDRALKQVATTLVATLRPNDIIGRWGGDEFVAIVQHVDAELLPALAERCRTVVANTSISGGHGKRAYLSALVRETLVRKSDTVEEIMRRADQPRLRRGTQRDSTEPHSPMKVNPLRAAWRVFRKRPT